MQVSIKVTGLEEARNALGNLGRQVNFAASRALNTTAFAINGELKKEMQRVFEGGATAYTLRAFNVNKADKGNLTASVALRTDGPSGGTSYTKALAHLFTGNQRKFKKIEGWLRGRRLLPNGLAVAPGPGMPLDSFGNMRRAALTEMLGVIGAPRNNLRVYRRNGAGKAQKATGYFVVLPGDKSRKHPGIYKRIETGNTSTSVPMVFYIDPVNYRRIIDLERLGRKVFDATFQPAMDAEIRKAIANAR